MRCDEELCPFWTGGGCACAVLCIDVAERQAAQRDLGIDVPGVSDTEETR
jgi:hypothetical protein